MSMLWVPYIIFKNTDSDEAVTVGGDIRTIVAVTREGEFVRSGPEVVDEVLYYICIFIRNHYLDYHYLLLFRLRYSKEMRT